MGGLVGFILAFALVQKFAGNAAEIAIRGCVDNFAFGTVRDSLGKSRLMEVI